MTDEIKAYNTVENSLIRLSTSTNTVVSNETIHASKMYSDAFTLESNAIVKSTETTLKDLSKIQANDTIEIRDKIVSDGKDAIIAAKVKSEEGLSSELFQYMKATLASVKLSISNIISSTY